MDLRLATIDDFSEVTTLAQQFVKESPYKRFDKQYLVNSVYKFLDKPKNETICLLLLDDTGHPVGFLAGMIYSTLFHPEKIATEIAWYVKPEFRKSRKALELMNAFEYWAEMNKCTRVCMSSLNDSKVEKLYNRKGYEKIEESFMKELNNGSN